MKAAKKPARRANPAPRTKKPRKPLPIIPPEPMVAPEPEADVPGWGGPGPGLREGITVTLDGAYVTSKVDDAAVRDLLTASIEAHIKARSVTQIRGGLRYLTQGFDRDALREACRLREAAHAADPTHSAPAWGTEQRLTPGGLDTHHELMTFYREQIARP